MTAPLYNAMELMICCAARALEDGRTVAVGTGVPCAAAMLAQRTHAPCLTILFEAGGVAPVLPTMPNPCAGVPVNPFCSASVRS